MNILYYLVFGIFYLISLLPLWVLYLFSNVLHFVFFRLLHYRQEIVRQNLTRSFPDKNPEEIDQIRRDFNRYFCDLIVEVFKTMSISKKSLTKRVVFNNIEIFKRYADRGQSVNLVLGHHGNWELIGAAFALQPYHKLYVIYHPLKNKIFDRLFYYMRTRLGNGLYPMNSVIKDMLTDRKKLTATAFIADQTPSSERAYWTTFLNQDTPIFTGVEKISAKLGYPVLFVSVRRTGRGFYEVTVRELTDDPASIQPGEISELHTRMLEKDIIAQPETWLWTHRRWKHKRSEENV